MSQKKEVTKCSRCYAVYRYKHVCNGTLVQRLRAQLEKYGDHTSMCAAQHSRNPCDCGFDKILGKAPAEATNK